MYQNRSFLVSIFIIIVALFVAYAVGVRPLDVGTDTLNYFRIYSNLGTGGEGRYEAGFTLLVRGLYRLFGGSSELFFAFLFCFNFFFIYKAFVSYAQPEGATKQLIFFLLFSLFVLSSDWFYVGVVNGIRHGMGLSILLYASTKLWERKIFLFILWFIAAALFHNSIWLILPFLFPILFFPRLPFPVYFIAFWFFALTYYLGLNELVIAFLSNASGLPLYEEVKFYAFAGEEATRWYGFDYRFVLYVAFWFVIFALTQKYLIKEEYRYTGLFLLKLYSVFSIYYFVLGFGGFSNRWAYAVWFLIPLLQPVFLIASRLSMKAKVAIAPLGLASTFYFVTRMGVL